jgi:hypothetical protein
MVHRRRVAAVVLATAVLGWLAACSTPNNTTNPPGATPNGTFGGGASPTTAAPPPVTYPATAEPYSLAAVNAWAGGDTTRLGQLTDPSATIFATLSAGDYNKVFAVYRCEGAAGSSYCTLYNLVGDTLILQLRNEYLGHAHAVIGGTWHPITFPTDLQAYAQEAIDAWQGHNTAAVALLTQKPGDTAFNVVPAALRTATWTYSHSEGAAGHLYYIWTDSAGDSIPIGFINPGIVSPPANRHHLIEAVVFSPHP